MAHPWLKWHTTKTAIHKKTLFAVPLHTHFKPPYTKRFWAPLHNETFFAPFSLENHYYSQPSLWRWCWSPVTYDVKVTLPS